MPFEVVETTRGPEKSHGSVSYMRAWRKGKDAPKGRPQLLVSIPTTIFISKMEKFVLMLGSGPDTKKIRIKGVGKNDKRGTEAKTLLHAVTLRFGYVPKFGDEIFDKVFVDTKRISDDEYEIQLPMDPTASD